MRSGGRDNALLFLLAVACGLANWSVLRVDPFLARPIIDAAEYLAMARAMVAGIFSWESVPIHGPVYPALLVPLISIFRAGLTPIYMLQIGLVGLSAVLVRSCGVKLGGRAHGNVAGILMAASPALLYFEVQVLPVTFQVLLHSAMLYLLVVRGMDDRRALLAAGICGGLSWLTHPGSGLFLLLLLPLVRRCAGGWAATAVFLAGMALPLVPVSAMNLAAGHGPLPVQGNAGLNLYIGNGEGANGTPRIRPGYAWERLNAMPILEGVEGSDGQNSWFLQRTVEIVLADPVRSLRLVAAKFLLFASGHPIDASQDAAWFRARSPLLRNALFDAAVLAPLAFAFLVSGSRSVSRFGIPAAGLAGYWISIALTVFAIRYRAPAWPFLALLAPAVVIALRDPPRIRAVWTAAAALGLYLLALLDPFGYGGYNPVRSEYNLGRIYYMEGNLAAGEKWFREAGRKAPRDPDPWNALGVLAMERGDVEGARSCFREALSLAPDYADAHFNHALLLARLGETGEAETRLKEALRHSPSHASAWYTLGILDQGRGEAASAEERYRAAVRCDPTLDQAWTALGALLAERGEFDEAERCFRRALDLDPGSAEAAGNLRKLEAERRR